MAFPQLFPQPAETAQKSYEMYPLNDAHRAIRRPGPDNGKDNHGASERFLLVKASQNKTAAPPTSQNSAIKLKDADMWAGAFVVGAGLFLLGAGPIGLLMYLGLAAAIGGTVAMGCLILSAMHRSA